MAEKNSAFINGSLGVKMSVASVSEDMKIASNRSFMAKVRHLFRGRDLFLHDGAAMRRFHLSSKIQVGAAVVTATAILGAVATLGQIAVSSVSFSHKAAQFASRQSEIMAMEDRVAALKADVAAVKLAARDHAARLEARQTALASLLEGKASADTLAAMVPAIPDQHNLASVDIVKAFASVDAQQTAMASQLRRANDARFAATATLMNRLGIQSTSGGGMGGPYEPVPASTPITPVTTKADPQFRALFDSWKRLDQLQTSLISIPSQKPVTIVAVNSGFGVRSDPFRGGRAMHAGVDIPGPYATPIYATADAIVGRSGWIGGYGNMIELEHGKGIQTRYGHLSSINVVPGTRIKRGQLIGLMGSTGRSTGNHLHYEVRIDGKAVNPIPFLQTADYLLAMQRRAGTAVAMGGPDEVAAPK
jgi:murein DD-endopeptidase MepM/ murein hydrolase activator NlpD